MLGPQFLRWSRVERPNNVGTDGGILISSIDPITARAGKWTADEDSKLKKAIKMQGGKEWAAIVALVWG
jgi:hypothetical protein